MTPNSVVFPTKPLTIVDTLKMEKQMAMQRLRPIRSPSDPKVSAPIIMPNSAACERARLGWGEVPLFHQLGQDRAIDEDVVAIDDEEQAAEDDDCPVEAAERGLVDNVVDHGACHRPTPLQNR